MNIPRPVITPLETWHVEIMTPSLESAYNDLVTNAEGSSLSHTLAWRDVLLDIGMGEPIYWLAFRGNQLYGALPAFVKRSKLGAVLNSLPFIQSTGGVICSPHLARTECAELVRILIRTMLGWCCDSEVQVACVIGSAFIDREDEPVLPISPDFHEERVVRAIDLRQPLDFRPSVLWSIKKAERYKPVLKEATSLKEARLVYEIYADNMGRIGVLPKDWTIFESIYARTADKRRVRFVWAEIDDEPVAGLILMWHSNLVDYFSVGCTDLGRRIQASSWLCDQQIRVAKRVGVKWWNWMASPAKEVYDFKKRWGGADKKYPIWVWRLSDITSWMQLSAEELAANFPGYYAVPYAWLSAVNNK